MFTSLKKYSGDLLFGLQIFLAWWFSIPQVIRSFTDTKGMTITWSLFCSIFVFVNLLLAWSQYKDVKSRKALQIVFIYGNWLVLWAAMLAVMTVKGRWTDSDSLLSAIVAAALAALFACRWKGSPKETFNEPITRGAVSLIVKSTPQLYIAYCIIDAGSNGGLAGATLAIGHVTVLLRILEICIAAKQDGWTRKNIGLMLSESGNELTWYVTTATWIAYL